MVSICEFASVLKFASRVVEPRGTMFSRRLSWFAKSIGVVHSKKKRHYYSKTILVVRRSRARQTPEVEKGTGVVFE